MCGNLSKISPNGMDPGVPMVLLEEIGISGENLPVQPRDHMWSHLPMQGIKPKTMLGSSKHVSQSDSFLFIYPMLKQICYGGQEFQHKNVYRPCKHLGHCCSTSIQVLQFSWDWYNIVLLYNLLCISSHVFIFSKFFTNFLTSHQIQRPLICKV